MDGLIVAHRRIRPMTAADFASLPDPCGQCTFWESGLRKQEWAERVTEQWGFCGVMAVRDGQTMGYLTLAPAGFVPRLGAYSSNSVSPDAAALVTMRVFDGYGGRGIGRQLVQSAAALMVRRKMPALEAIGSYRATGCVLPVSWLEFVGFAIVREHPVTPRLRMDLNSTLRWPMLSAVWDRLAGLVRQPAPPEPASFEVTQRESAQHDVLVCHSGP